MDSLKCLLVYTENMSEHITKTYITAHIKTKENNYVLKMCCQYLSLNIILFIFLYPINRLIGLFIIINVIYFKNTIIEWSAVTQTVRTTNIT